MPEYQAPLRDIRFVLHDLLDAPAHYAGLPGAEELSPDVQDAIINEGARFAEEVLAPLYASGDAEGCSWKDGEVTTPTGFKEAFEQYVAGGWPGLNAPAEYGGQDLPASLATVVNEMMGAANWAWSMYPGLTSAAVRCLQFYGSEAQQRTWMQPLIEGRWSGTMCLTEAHCGSDLGLLRTRATELGEGRYRLNGTKIFISSGEHDLTDNIVHMVLARIDGAPEGTRGISLFIVPKYRVDEDGALAERNPITCGSIEEKMGIHGSATCVMNLDDAEGYLVGEPNRGLNYMFIMMNTARLGTALQGLAHTERAWQGALAYARERLQMRSLSGPKNPDGPADPILVHPDVRRMLLTQKAIAEGSRAFIYWLALQVDRADRLEGEEAEAAAALLALLTPVAKAFCTEVGYECVNLGLQCFGGHGYVRESGMEQIVRDARIAMVYEGTTGIQALDLLGRKVMGDGGKALLTLTGMIEAFCREHGEHPALQPLLEPLQQLATELPELAMSLGQKAMEDAEEVGAAAVDYLMALGYVVLGWFWGQLAQRAQQRLDAGESDDFLHGKIKTARFYVARLMVPRFAMHRQAAEAGAATLMDLTDAEFGV